MNAADPWADSVESYTPGDAAGGGFEVSEVALGEPTRFTGELAGFAGAVTPFNPPFESDEIVSVGFGGELILGFDEPVTDDPQNPFGIDLLIFGNTGYIDADFPNGLVGGLFGMDGGLVELSADGLTWIAVDGVGADGPFPTLGYSDLSGPFDVGPGEVLSDFTKPVDPDFEAFGKVFGELVAGYAGSGGGAGIDIGRVGLSEVSFVRISDLTDDGSSVEIDALSDVAVPAPSVLAAGALALAAGTRRRRESAPWKRERDALPGRPCGRTGGF